MTELTAEERQKLLENDYNGQYRGNPYPPKGTIVPQDYKRVSGFNWTKEAQNARQGRP